MEKRLRLIRSINWGFSKFSGDAYIYWKYENDFAGWIKITELVKE